MRLVSAYYSGLFPFNHLNNVNGAVEGVMNTDELQPNDALIVWGGADIAPSLYNKGRSSRSHAYNKLSQRDAVEWALMNRAKELNIPIIGVCRGAQMLCALEGGFLYQDVDGHSGKHYVNVADQDEGFFTNSIHHQMMVPAGDFKLLAWSEPRSTYVWDVDANGVDVRYPAPEKEPEFIYYPQVKGFAIQWHPEMMDERSKATQYVLNIINEYA